LVLITLIMTSMLSSTSWQPFFMGIVVTFIVTTRLSCTSLPCSRPVLDLQWSFVHLDAINADALPCTSFFWEQNVWKYIMWFIYPDTSFPANQSVWIKKTSLYLRSKIYFLSGIGIWNEVGHVIKFYNTVGEWQKVVFFNDMIDT
jgi:hypothetical protein